MNETGVGGPSKRTSGVAVLLMTLLIACKQVARNGPEEFQR